MLQAGQLVRVNLAGLQAEGVMFQAAVTDAVGHIVKQASERPPRNLVKPRSPKSKSLPRASTLINSNFSRVGAYVSSLHNQG